MKARNRNQRHATKAVARSARSKAGKPKATRAGRARSRAEAVSQPPDAAVAFPIVGIGASETFTELLKHLPGDTGMGFVLVQHLDPVGVRGLAEILSRATKMPVCEVSEARGRARSHSEITFGNRSRTIGAARRRALHTGGVRSPDF